MFQKLLAISAALFVLGACEQTQPVATPPPPPQAPAPQSYTVLFKSGQATLSSESVATIQQAASAYKPGASVSVTGHTDTTGSENLNQELAQHRATSVKDALVRDGVPDSAITMQGHAQLTLPVQTAANVNEQRNRSVDITVVQMAPAPLMSDSQYCAALSAQYRKYNHNAIDEQASHAMSQCPTADAAAAIPVLEQHLRALDVELPSRTLPRS